MAQIRKYAFDKEFAPDGQVLRDAARRLTPEEAEAERRSAYERGKQDSLAQAEHRIAAALEALAAAAQNAVSRLDAESWQLRDEAARLALSASRKVAGAALDRFGQERAAAAIEQTMEMLRHQPRLLVRLPPDAAEALRPHIEEIGARHAYAGAVLVRAEPGLTAGAVSIDWSDGMIDLDPKELQERIDALIETALAAPTSSA